MEHYYPAAPVSVTGVREGTRKAAAADRKKSGTRGGGGGNGVRLSTDPQSVAARQRRHRISDRFKILQGLVPGGDKMDTASLLEEAIRYVKFLKSQIRLHQTAFGGLTDEDDCGEEADPPLPPGGVDDRPPVEYSVPYSDDCCLGNHVTDAPPFYSVGDSVAAAQPVPAAVEFGYIGGCDSVSSYPQMSSVFSYPN